ncbi:MAG: M20 family metallopeptidase [Candidatus Omnitrophota bacterium]
MRPPVAITFRDINNRKKDIIKFARELVRIPTINPPGENYEKIVSVLERECRKVGLVTKRIVLPPEELRKAGVSGGSKRICLLARWNTKKKHTLHFNGHYDVVPVTSGWTVEPFKGIIKDAKLYGRGAEDMKGTIAAMIYAVSAVRASGITPRVNIELSFTPDEEIGGNTGLGYVVKKGFIKPHYALSEGLFGNYVSCGNKGVLWLEIHISGKSAHGSTPYKGINAFVGMNKLTNMLLKLKAEIEKRKTTLATMDARDKFATMVIGGALSGGTKTNIVPDYCSFTVDRRLLPEENTVLGKKEILAVVHKFIKDNPEFKVRVKTLMEESPVITNPRSCLCKTMLDCVKEVVKKKVKLAITPGATDLRFLIKRGIPAVGYNTAGLDRCHGDDEFVYIKSLLDTAKIYALLMLRLK